MSLYYEEFSLGEQSLTPRRTVTEADVTAFAGVSGDYHPLHTDAVGAANTLFGARVAHGLLGLSIATGLMARLGELEDTAMAFLNVDWNFKAPLFMGDTICARVTIADKRETSKPDRGILIRRVELLNQDGQVVQEGTMTVMVKRRPQPGQA